MMDEPMTATEVNRLNELAIRRGTEMAQNLASLPTPPWYAGPNPHRVSQRPLFVVCQEWLGDALLDCTPGAIIRVPSVEDFQIITRP